MLSKLFAGFRQLKQNRRRNLEHGTRRMTKGPENLETRDLLSAISWVGGTTGNWNVPGNWSLNRIPNATDQVTIDTATPTTVKIVAGDGFQISSLVTGTNDTLSFTDGALTISSTSTLAGPLTMTGGALAANGSSTVVNVNGATTIGGGSLFVSAGADLNLPQLTTSSAPANKPSTWQADGSGSEINAPALTTITNRSNQVFTVNVLNGADVDLSALTTVSNLSGTFAMSARDKDIANHFSTLDVSSLTNVGGSGNLLDVRNGGTILDANLTSWTNSTISVAGGIYNFSNLTSINTSHVFVASTVVDGLPNPGQLTLPNITTYTSTVPSGNGRNFEANGADAVLSLPALTTITNTGGGTINPRALNGGDVELPALTTVTNTNGTFNPFASDADADGNGSILNLSNLLNFNGSGNVLTVQDGAEIQFPKITNWVNNTIIVSGTAYSFPNLTNINTSSVFVSGGGSLTLPNVTSYTMTLPGGNGRLFQADGAQSVLNFPALTTITNSGGGSTQPAAFNGGDVELPALTTVTNTSGTFNPSVDGTDNQGNASIVNISNLQNFTGAGNVITVGHGGDLKFGTMTNWINNTIIINGGTYSFDNLTNINVSSISVIGGGSLTLPNVTTYSSPLPGGNGRSFSADGALSSLNFPALATITNTNSGSIQPRASEGGRVDMPALTTITSTVGTFDPTSEGTDDQGNPSVVNLSNLLDFNVASSSLTVRNQGEVQFGKITSWSGGTINVSGSAYTFANLTNVNNTSIVVSNHGSLTLPNVVTMTNNLPGGNGRILQADGAGSSLNFSGLTGITLLGGGTLTPRAVNGGDVELTALTTITLTNGQFNPEALGVDNVGTPSHVNLPALANLSGAGTANPRVTIGGAITLSGLSNLNGSKMVIDIGPGSQVTGPEGTIAWPISNTDGATVAIPLFPVGVRLDLNAATYSNMTINDSVPTPVVLSGGTFNGTTTLNLGAGATLDLTGGQTTTFSGQLVGTGDGTATLSNGNLQAGGGGLTLNLLDDMFQWTGGSIVSSQGGLTNAGGITATGGGSRQFAGGNPLTNTGSLSLAGGTSVTVGDDVDSSDGDISVSPGSMLNVQGILTLSPTSSVKVGVGGNNGTPTFGKIAATGAATLAGPLNVELLGGFVPAGGSTLPFLTAASLTGSFSPVTNVTPGGSPVGFTASSTAPGVESLIVAGAVAPIMSVKGNGQVITDGSTTTSATDDTEFGSSIVGTPISKTFTISNGAGATAPLTLGQVTISGANAGDFTVTSQPATSVVAGGSTTLTIQFNPSATGNRTATISFSEDDPSQASPFTFAISGNGTATVSSQITVTGNGAPISDGASTTSAGNNTDFGSSSVGTPISKTFTISNAAGATAPLTVGQVTISGANAGDFSVTSQPATSVAAGTSTTFTIQFNPSAAGNRAASVSFTEDDPTQASPFTFAIGGSASAVLSGLSVTGNGVDISDGATTTSVANDTAFGSTEVGTSITKTYTISNSADAASTLTIGAISLIQPNNPGEFTVVTQPATSLPPGQSTTFTIKFQPTAAGNRTAVVSFTEDAPSTVSPFTFAISGTGTASSTSPVITVTGNGQSIADGTTTTSASNDTHFGATVVKSGTSTPITQTFTITNAANATGALHLGTITIGGTNAGDFTVVTQPATTLAPGASTTFTIRFQPNVIGNRKAEVSFSEDDPGQATPFTFAISGEGVKKLPSVKPVKTTTTLTSDVTNPSPGSSITLTATVRPQSGNSIPTGTITFKNKGQVVGVGTLMVVNGQAKATVTTSGLVAGTNSLTAVFEGTSTLKMSTGKLKIKIAKPPRN